MKTNTMEVKLTVCAGLDVHAKTVVACVLTGALNSLQAKKESRTFWTRTFELRQLGEMYPTFSSDFISFRQCLTPSI